MKGQFAQEIVCLSLHYWECCADVERRKERRLVKEKLSRICEVSKERMNVSEPDVLLAFMDAYEVTRDERMLQDVLDVVSGNLEQLEVSIDSVKLLAYCFYYIEDGECVERARSMMKELRRRGENSERLAEVEKILEELT